jgi:hypothetical protein
MHLKNMPSTPWWLCSMACDIPARRALHQIAIAEYQGFGQESQKADTMRNVRKRPVSMSRGSPVMLTIAR